MNVSQQRLDSLRAVCAQRGLDAMYVRNTSDIEWLTSFDNVFDSEQAHAVLVSADEAILHTDTRYITACENAARRAGAPIEVSAESVSHMKLAARWWAHLAQGGAAALGVEDAIALAEFRKLEKEFAESARATGMGAQAAAGAVSAAGAGAQAAVGMGATTAASVETAEGATGAQAAAGAVSASAATLPFVETSGVVLGLRSVKDAGEIARMKAAQAITDAAFSHIVGFVRPGVTEREVQLELDDFMVRHGTEALAFPSIVAAGPNGASPHAQPGDTKLEVGQCVVLDFGARAQGYCSDMTRMVFLGAPEGKMLAAWETMRRANEEVQAMLKAGVTGREAHELAERILAEGGFGGKMGHGLGHGVGIDIHEEPVLAPRNGEPLKAGSVVTVEPGIYLPGEFGMRLEDFGVVTETGFDRFTQSTHELVVV